MKKTTLLCVCGVASWAARAALPDPIAYFSFDEIRDGAIADLSGNGRTLTVGPGCSLTNDAASGSALWLDGTTSTYATFQSPVLKQRTISLWYKRCHQPGPNFEEKYGTSDNNCRMPTLIAGLSKFNLRFNNSWANSSDHSLGIGNHDLVAYYGDSAYYSDSYFSYNRYPQLYPERWTRAGLQPPAGRDQRLPGRAQLRPPGRDYDGEPRGDVVARSGVPQPVRDGEVGVLPQRGQARGESEPKHRRELRHVYGRQGGVQRPAVRRAVQHRAGHTAQREGRDGREREQRQLLRVERHGERAVCAALPGGGGRRERHGGADL